jgi:DNA-binding FadR family transcriptional regulator
MRKGDEALQALRGHLAGLSMPEGARLAPERDLAAKLGLSRRALREGLARLEQEGRLWRGVGQGTFLGPRPASEPARVMPPGQPLDIMEARLALEPQLAGLAAVKGGAEHLAAIEQAVRRGSEAEDIEGWGRWDTALHRAVAQAAQNHLLLALFEQLESCRVRGEWSVMRAALVDEPVRHRGIAEHRRLLDAIAARDPAAAHAAMWDHLQSVASLIREAMRAGQAWGPAQAAAPVARAAETEAAG